MFSKFLLRVSLVLQYGSEKMSKFTKSNVGARSIVNYAGGEGFVLDDKNALLQLVSTCLVNEPKFYGKTGDIESDIYRLCTEIKSKYILQLASYARNELYLRSVPLFLLSIAARIPETKPYVRQYTPHIIKRADELNEALACYLALFDKPIPNSLKKGIADSFLNFDEYQFAKYNRKTSVTFKDTISLTHPKEPSVLISKILDGKLATPVTWEVEVSSRGNTPLVWEELIKTQKLPYMATLRNLRNLLTTGVSDECLNLALNRLKDPQAVRNSKQFPFRFLSAYLSVIGIDHPRVSDVLDTLEEAIHISTDNIPHMQGTTLIASDVSGSMHHSVSFNSSVEPLHIGLLLSSATHKYTDKSIVGLFGDYWKPMSIPKTSGGIISSTLVLASREGEVGYSTNGHKVVEWLNETSTFVDRILIFTDCQLWNSFIYGHSDTTINKEYQKYKSLVNPSVNLYMFNLSGYGSVNFPSGERSVVNISGWSDKVLNFIQLHEIDPNIQVKYIEENY